MESTSMSVEEILDGASNFISWKERVTLELKEYDLCEFVEKILVPSTYSTTLAAHENTEIKYERVILDSVKDHIIPHLSEKKATKEMFDSLVGLFQRTNMNRKMVLRNRLRYVKMFRSDNVTIYFMRITQECDELLSIGDKMDEIELVNVELNGLPKSWEPFIKGVYAQENFSDW
jgi:hypothetical protein